MLVENKWYSTIWIDENEQLSIIDQTTLPHSFKILHLETLEDVCRALSQMQVRGAGLIGATAGYGLWVAARSGPSNYKDFQLWMESAARALYHTRPTASNLAVALKRQESKWQGQSKEEAVLATKMEAEAIAHDDADYCQRIGEHGKELIATIAARKKGETVHILTHCNAGWLAFVDYGSALSPVYAARDAGIDLHVWVDETRPRNQGASLTAWELGAQGINHSLIADNAGGHLMQHGLVDMVITGADRVTRQGDVANKIGTYLKALAALDNQVPFYVALPSSTFDLTLNDGVKEIPIEERDASEVRFISGLGPDGTRQEILICPENTKARNWAFDVTPARLVTGLITERGICEANETDICRLFSDLM